LLYKNMSRWVAFPRIKAPYVIAIIVKKVGNYPILGQKAKKLGVGTNLCHNKKLRSVFYGYFLFDLSVFKHYGVFVPS